MLFDVNMDKTIERQMQFFDELFLDPFALQQRLCPHDKGFEDVDFAFDDGGMDSFEACRLCGKDWRIIKWEKGIVSEEVSATIH